MIVSATSIRYLIPGYPNTVDTERMEQIDKNNLIKLEEYEAKINRYSDEYFHNLSVILNGGNIKDEAVTKKDTLPQNNPTHNYNFKPTKNDSLLRLKIDEREKYDISIFSASNRIDEKLNGVLFFSPLKEITNRFDLKKRTLWY